MYVCECAYSNSGSHYKCSASALIATTGVFLLSFHSPAFPAHTHAHTHTPTRTVYIHIKLSGKNTIDVFPREIPLRVLKRPCRILSAHCVVPPRQSPRSRCRHRRPRGRGFPYL